MKTDINTFKAADLLATLAQIAPSVSIQTIWEHDNDIHPDIHKDCDGMDDEDPDDWQAWQSEVKATAICNGEEVSGSAYLGGTWEKWDDMPAESNPEISGYLPQMIIEALEELAKECESSPTLLAEIGNAIEII